MLARTLFSFLCIIGFCHSQIPSRWYVEFFEDINCTGQSENVTITEDALDTKWVTNASSVKVVGLWTLTILKDEGGGRQSGPIITFENAQPELQKCYNKSTLIATPDFQDYHFYHAEVIISVASLILSTEENFRGLRYHASSLIPNGTLIPRPTKMESLVLIEKSAFLIHPETNFQGIPKCVQANHTSYGYTVIKPWQEIVRSVKPAGVLECSSITTTTPAGASCNIISFFLISLSVGLNFILKSS